MLFLLKPTMLKESTGSHKEVVAEGVGAGVQSGDEITGPVLASESDLPADL